ncbi:DNA alkylation repair protein [candidate division KSB1 bacterium]|nr:DNA alkylation repair protein [candidate division KSB1 bacterium]
MEFRKPKKGEGVPKETPARNSIAALPNDLKKQLEWLCFTGALEGTWPRELSATILHNLIIRHGVAGVLPLVREWIKHENPAVRRLVTEAFRPRGVMLAHINDLKEDPSPLKKILEPLLDDPSDYVQKSVANNLNDISKDNPEIILKWTKEWNTPDATKQRHWILARALRTLIDEGHPAPLSCC